jgi:hypothetical protein
VKPIIMFGAMVRAILDGRKTMTRRVMKPQPELRPGTMKGPTGATIQTAYWHWRDEWWWSDPQPSMLAKCPFQPGTSLWVRETWGIFVESWTDYGWEGEGIVDIPNRGSLPQSNMHSKYHVVYKADGYETDEGERWKSPIYMPRWASRLTLRVTGVKVERLHRIGELSAKAEGVEPKMVVSVDRCESYLSYCAGFIDVWDSINAKRGYSWESNPFVWAISFEVVR